MYTENDYQQQKQYCKKLLLALCIPSGLVFIGIFLLFLLPRVSSTLTIFLTILLFGIFIFVFDFYIQPQRKYLNHIDHALHGKTRQLTAYFDSMEQTVDKREGVFYYPLLVHTDKDDPEESQRLLYYDANQVNPQWQKNQLLRFTIYDKFICAWESVQS